MLNQPQVIGEAYARTAIPARLWFESPRRRRRPSTRNQRLEGDHVTLPIVLPNRKHSIARPGYEIFDIERPRWQRAGFGNHSFAGSASGNQSLATRTKRNQLDSAGYRAEENLCRLLCMCVSMAYVHEPEKNIGRKALVY